MKRLIVLLVSVAAAVLVAAPIAQGHNSPCGGDGPGNSHYAQHHISFLAKQGLLGDGGHKPGSHKGFSVCNPSGK